MFTLISLSDLVGPFNDDIAYTQFLDRVCTIPPNISMRAVYLTS